jgi:hypothetical protein
MTVQMLCENTTSMEITEWLAFLSLEAKEKDRQQKIRESEAKTSSSGMPQPEKFNIFDIPEEFEDELNG